MDLHPLHKALRDEVTGNVIDVDPDILAALVKKTVGKLVVGLNKDQKASVQRFTLQAAKEGWDEAQLASRINSVVGLDPRRVTAVENYRTGLIAKGVPKGIARRESQKYAKRLRVERSLGIARTELAELVGAAKRESWIAARRDGRIDQYAVRVWHTSPDERKCAICKPMNGQRAAIDRPYMKGMTGPPAHPSCRCWETLERGPDVLAKSEEHVESALSAEFRYRSLV